MEKIKQLWLISILIAIIIGSGLRFYHLGERSLSSGEIYSVALASMVGKNNDSFLPEIKHPHLLTLEDNFWTWKLTDPHPPLYDVFLAGWVKIAGTSDFAVRLPSVLFGIFLLIYSFFRLRKILPIETLFYYIAWLSLSLILIRYAQESRPYGLTALFSGMLTVEFARLFLRNFQDFTPISWQFIIIALILSYSHFYGLLLAGIFSVWISFNILWRRNYKEFLKFILLGIGIFPLIISIIHVKQYVITLHPLDSMFNFDKMFFVSLSQVFENILPKLGFFVFFIVCISLFFIIKNQIKKPIIHLSLTLLAITLLFVLLMTIGMQGKNGWIGRYFIAGVPVLILGVSILLTEIKANVLLKSIFLIVLLCFPLYETWGNIHKKHPYREASQFVGQHITDKDILLTNWKANFIFYLHYLQPYGRTQANNKTIPFNNNEITPTNCQLLRNQLQQEMKVFLYYHMSDKDSIKQLLEMCQFPKNKVTETVFNYLGVTIYQQ